ncbi:DNA polymerase III subunit gamma/tau [Burkholderia sp. L27(2015)]|uniref:DNA polymerase III subunit gamma/tau n=1 Tax=Burkholderia sp. L27(2015) TaxID=1641858 RepID=UPI00131BCC2E|nr:DNA polymerase III subunit gamma/tau [Burkholderia sp. L27(2015)]
MTYQVLARKWRPRDFASLVGQEHVVRALTHALEQQRLHHAYLFTGTRGVGKTTLSRILAKALNCETGITATPCGVCKACREIDEGRFIDYVEMDAASNRGVDEMAALLERAVYAPVDARFKVYMIDEVHMLTNHAFNAMLKTLEEPPAHVKFILATTDPQKIPVTVLSRCLQFNLKQMPATHIVTHLEKILTDEQIGFETQALRLLARAADGSMRDALSLTDQAIAYAAGVVSEEAIRGMLGALDQSYLIRLLDAVAAADGVTVLAIADEMAARSLSFSVALQDLASLLHRVAWAQHAPASVLDEWPEAAEIRRFAALLAPQDIQLYYQIATIGRSELGVAPDEYAGFTMSLLRMLAFQPAAAADGPAGSAPANPAPLARSRLQAAPADVGTASAVAGVSRLPAQVARSAAASMASRDASAAADSMERPGIAPAVAPVIAPAAAPVLDVAAVAPLDASVTATSPVANPITSPVASPSGSPSADVVSRAATVTANPVPVSTAPNPARAALDALRNSTRAGLRVAPERQRTETPAPKRDPAAAASAARAMPLRPPGPPPAPVRQPEVREPEVRQSEVRQPATPYRAVQAEPASDAAAYAFVDGGSTVAPWDDLPPDDFYPDGAASGADAFEPFEASGVTSAFNKANGTGAASAAALSGAFESPAQDPSDDMARERRRASAIALSSQANDRPANRPASRPEAAGSATAAALPAATLTATAPATQIDLTPLGFTGYWPALAALLPLKGLAQQLAHQSELMGLDGQTLKLRVAASLADAVQIAKLKAALIEHLGRPVSLDVMPGVAAWSAALVDGAERAVRQREAEQVIAEDTFVQALIRDFDASIVRGSIRPIQ